MPVVLIVDDSPTEVHVLKTHLEKNGFDTLIAEDGESGLRLAKEKQPDLIIMDVVMPGMRGFQATRQLAKDPATQNMPVVIVTTQDQETDKVWGMRQGAYDYLVKPVNERQLVDKVNEALAAKG